VYISFESSPVDNILERHQSNLTVLDRGELRLSQLNLVRSFYAYFLDIGFLNLIAYVGYSNFFSVLKDKVLIDTLKSNEVPYDILNLLADEFNLPDDVVVMMVYSLSKVGSEGRVFNYSLLNKDVLELMESIIVENPLFSNLSFDLFIQSLLVDVKKELYFQTSIYLRDIYAEIVFYKKINQSMYSLSSLNSLLAGKEVFYENEIPVISVLGYYRNQYLKFLRDFKLDKSIVF
jgi:hypothetical protein